MSKGDAIRHNGQPNAKHASWFQYRCPDCNVEWTATEDERIPTTCWMCEQPTGVVKTQAGIPVRYYPEEVGK